MRSTRGRIDAVGVVEAAYDLDAEEEEWLRALAQIAGLDAGLGMVAYVHDERLWADPVNARQQQRLYCWNASPGFLQASYGTMRSLPAEWIRWAHACAPPVTTVAEMTGAEDNVINQRTRRLGGTDGPGVFARDAMGRCAVFQGVSSEIVRLTDAERRLWERLTVHIGAGLRLRAFLGARPTLEDPSVEAVLDPGGRCVEARAGARARSARAALREAARLIDRARGANGRSAPEDALELWRGLTAGRWSLVDHFDSDGRRFVVARRNEPEVTDPRTLTLRQRQVAALAATGRASKLIAYTLGISDSAVSAHLREALRRLGLGSVAELRAAAYPVPERVG
jgi:DNA-binding CsgD family transcriptional regulator